MGDPPPATTDTVVDDPPPATTGTAAAIPNHFSATDYAARCKVLLELSAALHKLE